MNHRWRKSDSVDHLTQVRRKYNGEEAYKGVRVLVKSVEGAFDLTPAVEDGTDTSEVLLQSAIR